MAVHNYRSRGRSHDQLLLRRSGRNEALLAQSFNVFPRLWVTAKDALKELSDGDMAEWPSRAASVVQGSATLQPELLGETWPNGGPCVYADAVGEAFALAGLDFSDVDKVTVGFVVHRTSTGATGAIMLYGGSSGWSSDSFEFGIQSADKLFSINGDAAAQEQTHNDPTNMTALSPVAYVLVFDRSLVGTAQNKLYNADGFVAQTEVFTGTCPGNFDAAGNCWIGAENNGAVFPADMFFRELIAWPIAFTAEQATLAAKALAAEANLSA